ncbi:MAG TPA: hypothetical protein VIL07_11280 [Symbiobacteriaceae bacterium]
MTYGYPATLSKGFSNVTPVFSFGKAPFGFGKFGKFPFGKFGYPATKTQGFSSKVPVTKVATSPYPWI